MSFEDRKRVEAAVKLREERSGLPSSIGKYTKHAVLSHERLSSIETGVKNLLDELRKLDDPWVDRKGVVADLEEILGASS